MTKLAIIGGTGVTMLDSWVMTHQQLLSTPFGEPSAPVMYGTLCGKPILFLLRHGLNHTIPPHKINYRANLWMLKTLGAESVIAIAAVGAINVTMQPRHIVIPHQLIDYTWGRAHTFFEETSTQVTHIDFTHPYTERIRQALLNAADTVTCVSHRTGVYGATQGPRLETAAEIERMARDGCDIVGMTGMPEAGLAREIGLEYAICAIVANPAAGRSDREIAMADIEQNVQTGMQNVMNLLREAVAFI